MHMVRDRAVALALPDTIGGRIRTRRERLKISQADFARAVNAHPTVVWRWETSKSVPDSEHTLRIAAALRVSMDWLVTGAGKKRASS